MSFLNGLFLLALPLALVPLLIHLYRGRQRDVVLWGAMQFLEKAMTKGRSWQRLEELLLMFLRTAAVLAIVFALARPMVRSSWWGSQGQRELVLLLDNSLSMARTVEDTSAADVLKDEATKFLDSLSSEDRVHVMLVAGGGQWLTAQSIVADRPGVARLKSLVEGVEPSQGKSDLLRCILSIVHLESVEMSTSRRVVVFTDNQELSWQFDAEQSWQQLGTTLSNAEIPTSVQIIECVSPTAEIDNLAVTTIEADREIVRPGEVIECRAEVTNLGTLSHEAGVVEWLIDDEVVSTSSLKALEGGETTHVTTEVRRSESGTYQLACRIEEGDQLALDQQDAVVVEVTDQIPVLFVLDSAQEYVEKTTQEFVSAALGYEGLVPLEWHSVYQPTFISPKELAETDLAQYRAVVISDPVQLDDETLGELQGFVRDGGGLWLVLGDRVDRTDFNRSVYDDGDGLSPLPVEALFENQALGEESGRIHPPTREHPATAQLANTTQLDIDEARIKNYWRFAHRSNDERSVKVLLETGDGSPLVIENYLGQGRVLVQSFPLGLGWSNLPQLKAFVVLISDWLDYLTAPSSARFNLAAGSPLVATLPLAADPDSVKVLNPAGTSVPLGGQELDNGQLVRYWQTHLPGSYRVTYEENGVSKSLPFRVAREVSESRLKVIDEPQRQLLTSSGLEFGTEAPLTNSREEESTSLEPVWQSLLVGLIALLVLELIISSWITGQRSTPVMSPLN